MSETIISLSAIAGTQSSIVGAAETVAEHALEAMAAGNTVVVSLQGVRGVSSSFFNVVLTRVHDVHGEKGVNALRFVLDNDAQKAVLERSVAAVTGKGGRPVLG